MKLKKKTGIMLAAASTAAVVGIAAVSFAAWTGSNTQLTAQAATGTATLFGFTENQADANLNLGTLVPYDQPADSIETGTTYVSVALPEYSVYSDYSVEVKSETEMTFYVLVGAQVTAAPASVDAAVAAGWQKVTAEGVSFDLDEAAGKITNTYISLILVSSNNAEAGQTNIGFNVTLVLPEA